MLGPPLVTRLDNTVGGGHGVVSAWERVGRSMVALGEKSDVPTCDAS